MTLFIAGETGLEPVQQDPKPRDTHPVRLILAIQIYGDWDPLREVAYEDVEAANTDLEYMGQSAEDIKLVACEGVTPTEIGFEVAY